MALHYRDVIKINSIWPLVIVSGPSETGKTTAITSGLSVTGINPEQFLSYTIFIFLGAKNGIYVKETNAFFLERSSISSLLVALMTHHKWWG